MKALTRSHDDMKKSANARKLLALRVIPVLRLGNRRDAEAAIDCLIEAGFQTVELTLTTPGAIDFRTWSLTTRATKAGISSIRSSVS